jgi:hypothetical protein
MSNRHDRRAQSAQLRKLRAKNPQAKIAEALLSEFAQANEALQRSNTYLEYATRAAQNASTITVIPLPEGHEAIDGDPNWERSALIAEATEKIERGKANLAAAFLDACSVLEKLDEPVSDIQVVSAIPNLNLRG